MRPGLTLRDGWFLRTAPLDFKPSVSSFGSKLSTKRDYEVGYKSGVKSL